jgi:hypothetical protein
VARARRAAVSVAIVIMATATGAARAHDPLEATTIVQIGADAIEVRSVLGSRRAFSACGRARFDACAGELYRLTVAGRSLSAESARGELRPDGDLELVTRHRRPAAGSLRILALHIQRSPNEMAGTIVTVLEGARTLRRETLDSDRPQLDVPLSRRPQESAAPAAISTRPTRP